jgi:hypothetical protein
MEQRYEMVGHVGLQTRLVTPMCVVAVLSLSTPLRLYFESMNWQNLNSAKV